jgi:hypothetical protein
MNYFPTIVRRQTPNLIEVSRLLKSQVAGSQEDVDRTRYCDPTVEIHIPSWSNA